MLVAGHNMAIQPSPAASKTYRYSVQPLRTVQIGVQRRGIGKVLVSGFRSGFVAWRINTVLGHPQSSTTLCQPSVSYGIESPFPVISHDSPINNYQNSTGERLFIHQLQ